jgi:hypothetical protein
MIDNHNSSEIWSSFRVASRAKVDSISFSHDHKKTLLSAAHNGYQHLPGHIIHQRTWELSKDTLIITDTLVGHGKHDIKLFFHFHPNMHLAKQINNSYGISDATGQLLATILVDNALYTALQVGYYAPEFGKLLANKQIVGSIKSIVPMCFKTIVSFKNIQEQNENIISC